jgi:polar amino acid transport system substrate-binding protein
MSRMSSKWSGVSFLGVLVIGALSVLVAPVEAQSPKSGTAPTPEARQALAPTGKLRVGLYLGGPSSVIRESTSGEMKGVGFDLGRELAQRMGVPFEPVVFPSIGALLDSGKSDQWDVAFFAVSPARAKDFDFTAPHLEIELGYLVPSGSSIATSADVDRPGVRVGVPEKGMADVVLSRDLKNAVVVRGPGLAAGLEMLKSGSVDAFGANKANLFEISDQLPGSQVLDGRFTTEQQAMAIPKGRDPGMAYARQFIEDAKSEGLVKTAVKRAGLRGAVEASLQ